MDSSGNNNGNTNNCSNQIPQNIISFQQNEVPEYHLDATNSDYFNVQPNPPHNQLNIAQNRATQNNPIQYNRFNSGNYNHNAQSYVDYYNQPSTSSNHPPNVYMSNGYANPVNSGYARSNCSQHTGHFGVNQASNGNLCMPYEWQNNNFMHCSTPRRKEKKDKRNRTSFDEAQLKVLELEFLKDNYVDKIRRRQLSLRLRVPERTIKIWFQNRRMKQKKEKQKPNETSGMKDIPPPYVPNNVEFRAPYNGNRSMYIASTNRRSSVAPPEITFSQPNFPTERSRMHTQCIASTSTSPQQNIVRNAQQNIANSAVFESYQPLHILTANTQEGLSGRRDGDQILEAPVYNGELGALGEISMPSGSSGLDDLTGFRISSTPNNFSEFSAGPSGSSISTESYEIVNGLNGLEISVPEYVNGIEPIHNSSAISPGPSQSTPASEENVTSGRNRDILSSIVPYLKCEDSNDDLL